MGTITMLGLILLHSLPLDGHGPWSNLPSLAGQYFLVEFFGLSIYICYK